MRSRARSGRARAKSAPVSVLSRNVSPFLRPSLHNKPPAPRIDSLQRGIPRISCPANTLFIACLAKTPQLHYIAGGGAAMIRVQEPDFDIGAEIAALRKGRTDAGAIAAFIGTVRGQAQNDGVGAMTLEHYPGMTEK